MGPNLRNMPKNKGWGTEKSHRGLRQMMTSNASCRQSRRVQELLRLKGTLLNKRFKGGLATIVPRPILWRGRVRDKLLFGTEIRRKTSGKGRLAKKKKRHNPIYERGQGKKKQMKAYADGRKKAQESSSKIVLLKQNRCDTLTPAYDPRPYATQVRCKGGVRCVDWQQQQQNFINWDQEWQPMDRQPANRHIEVEEVPGEGNIVMQEAHSRPTMNPGDQYTSQNFYVGNYLQGLWATLKKKGEV